MKYIIRLCLFTWLFCHFFMVTSVSASDYGPYINLGIGQTEVDTYLPNFDEDTSVSVGAGFSLNRNLAFEANYIDFGDPEDDFIPTWTLSVEAVEFNAVGKIPFNPIATGYAKIGFFSWDAEVTEAGFGLRFSNDGTDATFGLGIQFHLTEAVSTSIQYQRYPIDLPPPYFDSDTGLDNVSVGLQVGF